MRYLEGGRELCIPTGETVYEAGAPHSAAGVYFVVSGKVRLERRFADGHALKIDAEPESLFGMVETMTHQPMHFTARAVEETRLYLWDQESFERAVSIYIELAASAVQALSRQLRRINEETRHLA